MEFKAGYGTAYGWVDCFDLLGRALVALATVRWLFILSLLEVPVIGNHPADCRWVKIIVVLLEDGYGSRCGSCLVGLETLLCVETDFVLD